MRVSSILKNRVSLPFKVLVNDISNKEVKLGFVRFFTSLLKGIKISNYLQKKQQNIILNELKKEFGDILEKFKGYNYNAVYDATAPVWISWLQGYDSAPDIVKKCVKSIQNSTNHPVNLIDLKNIQTYLDLPPYIMEKYKKGIITNAQFSDILRMSLLSEYGGLWIDATVFIPDVIPEPVFENEFYTCKREPRQTGYISGYRWTSFINGCQKGCIVQKIMKELFFEYWKRKNYLIDYLLVDYFMFLVYDNIPSAKYLIDNLPYNNSKVEDFQNVMNMEFNNDDYKRIIEAEDTIFYKLSWRMDFSKYTDDGSQTFFGYFMDEM